MTTGNESGISAKTARETESDRVLQEVWSRGRIRGILR